MKAPTGPRDDSLGELIEKAAHEVAASVHPDKLPPGTVSQSMPSYRPPEEQSQAGVWLLLGGGILLVVAIIVLIVMLVH